MLDGLPNQLVTPSRRQILLAGSASLLWTQATGSAAQRVPITPEHFGARGDGRANDTDAFAAMAAFVSAQGGGEIALRKTTYLVGKQTQTFSNGADYAFAPARIMEFAGCTRPLVIRGNGARLMCAPGLRYGTFNPVSGAPTRNPMPYFGTAEIAAPYFAMIKVEGCSAAVEISDLELDGSLPHLRIGGQYGDVGWQVPGTGIQLFNNSGPETLSRIRSHHHPLDGVTIDGLDERAAASRLDRVVCEYNGRQGCSVVGGRNYWFSDCRFNHTGKSRIASAPGAGVDVEAEAGKRVRDLRFSRCEFSNNIGAGLVADSGPSEGALFENCTFVGTTNWAAWPRMPRFRFTNCSFVGPIVHAFGDANPERAAQFHDCTFRDDPALSPTGEIYGGENESRPIADLAGNPNVLFNRCRFVLTHQAVLPWSLDVTYADCVMSQRAPARAYPRGIYVGRNVITGNVDLYASRIRGEVILNGRRLDP